MTETKGQPETLPLELKAELQPEFAVTLTGLAESYGVPLETVALVALHVGLDTMLTTDKAHEALRQVAALAKAPTGAPI